MELTGQFEQAISESKSLPSRPDNETMLKLYSLYKQATEGDVKTDPPSNPFDIVAKAKYNAWEGQKSKSKEDSMQDYIKLVNDLKG